jgi:putative aldouronate transport system permease protein
MYFSGGLIPSYLLTSKTLHLNDTYWALILPALINTYNLIIMRTSFESIPVSLDESARLDGAGHWTLLLRIVLPLSLPIIAVMMLYYALHIGTHGLRRIFILKQGQNIRFSLYCGKY